MSNEAAEIQLSVTEPETPAAPEKCASCAGTGEVYTDNGFDCCSECGGSGTEWPTPTTRRGRVLIDDLQRLVGPNQWNGFREEQIARSILAIEAEAAALAARPALDVDAVGLQLWNALLGCDDRVPVQGWSREHVVDHLRQAVEVAARLASLPSDEPEG